MLDTDDSEILAHLEPTKGRFWFGIISIGGLGLFLFWIALMGTNLELLGRVIIIAFGSLALFLAWNIRKSGLQGIILTKAGLFDTTGEAICTVEQIHSVDRSFFAFKPSNGFLVTLKSPMPRSWHPGLWWRIGKRIGVGGITSAGSGKAMADMLTLLLKDPDFEKNLFN